MTATGTRVTGSQTTDVRLPSSADVEHRRGPRPWSAGEGAWVATASGLVLLAAWWHLGHQSLSGDEAATWAISGHSLGSLVRVLRSSSGDRAAGLYYLAVWGWVRVFGTGAAALRGLSAVAAVVTLVPFHAVARRLGRVPAAIADVVFVGSSFFLTYARDARSYALVTLLVVLASWRFLRACESDRARDWVIYAGVAVLAVYTQWFAILVVAAHFATLALPCAATRWTRRARTTAASLAVAGTPIGVLVAAGQTGSVNWIAPLSGAQLRVAFDAFVGSTLPVAELAVAGGLVAGVLAVRLILRRPAESPGVRRTALLAATWFLVPVLVTVGGSAFKPLLLARYLIVALPGFALLLALGLTHLARGRAALTAVAVGVVLTLGSPGYDKVWAARRVDEDWRGVVATIEHRAGPDDAIVVFPASARYGFGYYARDEPALAGRLGPAWPPGPWTTPFASHDLDTAAVVMTAEQLRASVVWLVVREPGGPTVRPSTSQTAALLAARQILARRFPSHHEVSPFTRHTVSVIRYSTSAAR